MSHLRFELHVLLSYPVLSQLEDNGSRSLPSREVDCRTVYHKDVLLACVHSLPVNLDTLKASVISDDCEGTRGTAVLTEGEGGGGEREVATRVVILHYSNLESALRICMCVDGVGGIIASLQVNIPHRNFLSTHAGDGIMVELTNAKPGTNVSPPNLQHQGQ